MDYLEEAIIERVEEIIPLPDVGFRVMLLQYTFKDLGWTTFDLSELVANLKEEFEVEFEVVFEVNKFIDVENEDTIEDLVNYISLLKGI